VNVEKKEETQARRRYPKSTVGRDPGKGKVRAKRTNRLGERTGLRGTVSGSHKLKLIQASSDGKTQSIGKLHRELGGKRRYFIAKSYMLWGP